jgi:hypothetical protein
MLIWAMRPSSRTNTLLPPLIVDKWKALDESSRTNVLVKRVIKLHRAGLKACHYTK